MDKIKRWNKTSNIFQTIATLPAKKAGAHREVVGNKLYIFGGQQHWLPEPPNDVIFIHDFVEGIVETTNLPEPVFRAFPDVYKGKIFIAGQLIDADPFTQDFDIFLAIFIRMIILFIKLETTLSDECLRAIHQMAIVKNDL